MEGNCSERDTSLIGSEETILSLDEATEYVNAKWGRRVHHSTLWRWCRVGIGGVQLEYVCVGRCMATSQEAICRFFNLLSKQCPVSRAHSDASARNNTVPHSTPSKNYEAARCRLTEEGF